MIGFFAEAGNSCSVRTPAPRNHGQTSAGEHVHPFLLIFLLAGFFMAAERAIPGRDLPQAPGWYARAALLNAAQLGIVLLAGVSWNRWFEGASLLALGGTWPPVLTGFVAWFIGTFICGSYEAAGWYNVFAAGGEMFYHSNLRTPHWCGWFMQRPEHHSIHHQLDVHGFNFGDITWWDRLFGTFKDTDTFAPKCGFPNAGESRLGAMFLGKDVYRADVQEADGKSVGRP
jgi:Fatty acid hydroxylase superfamily